MTKPLHSNHPDPGLLPNLPQLPGGLGGPLLPAAGAAADYFGMGAPAAHGYNYEENTVFVIMSFDESENEVYYMIKKACKVLGFRVQRADEILGSDIVISNIIKSIMRAEFIICDLSLEKPNVYFELGYAQAAGNSPHNTLLIARKGTQLHFDVRHLHIHQYSSMDDLYNKLKKNLTYLKSNPRPNQAKNISGEPNT